MGIYLGPKASLEYWRGSPPNHSIRHRSSGPTRLPESVSDWGGVSGVRNAANNRLYAPVGNHRGGNPSTRRSRTIQPIDILVGSVGARSTTGDIEYLVHSAPLPAGSFCRIGEDIHVCSPELCAILMARHLDEIDLVRLMYELCGGYSMRGVEGGFIQRRPLTTIARIRCQLRGMEGFREKSRLLTLAETVLDGAMSPMEAACAMTLLLPRRLGGYALRMKPQLNKEIRVSSPGKQIISKQYLMADMYWANTKLVVEYDSSAEHEGASRIDSDNNRRVALQHIGYRVVTITRSRFSSAEEFDKVYLPIARILGIRTRKPAASTVAKRNELLRRLRRPVPF